MARQTIKIESILNGWSTTQYAGSKGSFNSSIAIDPDFPLRTSASHVRTSGMIIPVVYENFSATEIDGSPNWIITNTKTNNSFVYTGAGKLHSFNSSIVMRTTDEKSTALPITITGGAGNGAAYYDNFIYLAEAADVSQYGGMNQGASIAKTENVWTGGKFGKAALTNTTYPTLRGVKIPNHPMHVHGDNALYFGDVVDGRGVLHKIKTTKSTFEGDTDDGSGFNVLDLPSGFLPTDIESWGTDLVISAIQTTDTGINQGKAAIFIWDPTDTDSFYRGPIFLPDPLVTALLNINGIVHIWSGNAVNGVRLSRYLGGETIEEVKYMEEGVPPLAGAVDATGGRIVWGGNITQPGESAGVLSYGSKISRLPKGLNHIMIAGAAGGTPVTTSIKYVQQDSSIRPKLIVGSSGSTTKKLEKRSTTATFNSVFRTEFFNIGEKFEIESIRIPLGSGVAANMSIAPTIFFDDISSSVTLTVINNTNYPNSDRKIIYKNPDLKTARGENNFFIEFRFAGTAALSITLPIVITINTFDDEK